MRYRALVAFAIGLAAVGAARAQGAPKVTLMPSAARRGFSSPSIACWISVRLLEKISRRV